MARTTPHAVKGLPLQALRVEVIEGEDAGKSFTAQSDRLTVGSAPGNDLALADGTVSRYHLELARDRDRIRVTDLGSTNGTIAGGIALEKGRVAPGTVLALGKTKLKVLDGETVNIELHAEERLGMLRGRAPSMRRLMAAVKRLAATDTSVLVLGESGTGKELIARAIHELGARAKKPFVTVDCGSLSPSLIASELFGHEKGAFTGAEQRYAGAFEQANGGTVFLDEVGELPAGLQPSLLGALERRRFKRVGGKEEVAVDVRVIAATNRDLRAEVNAGTFRLDLYYRLAVVMQDVPPLRERPEDVPVLVEHFLREAGRAEPVEDLVSDEAMRALSKHHWPGNVRELRNLVEATLAMGEVPDPARGAPRAPAAPAPAGDPGDAALAMPYREARRAVLDAFESRYLSRLIERVKGNVSNAAKEARMDRSHLIDLLRRHGLK